MKYRMISGLEKSVLTGYTGFDSFVVDTSEQDERKCSQIEIC